MKQVLFCVDQSFLKDLIRINFRHSQSIQPIITSSLEEAVALFNLTDDIEMIVTQTIVQGEQAAALLHNTISNEQRKCQMIVIGENPHLKGVSEVYPVDQVRDVFNRLREKLGTSDDGDGPSEDSVSMPAHLFLHFKALPFDIFLKVQQGNEAKFIKRFNASEPLDHEAISKYMSRGVEDFYLKREWLKDFSKLLIQQLEIRLTESLPSSEGQLAAEGEVFNSLKDMVKSLGLKPQVQKLCEISMQNVQRRLHEESPFKSFLENLKSNQELNFHFAFVQLSSLLCSQYIEHTDWPKKQKDDLIEKLVFSAFFCDMNLSNDEMLMARTEEDLLNFNSKEMDILNSHAQKTADTVKNYPGAPQDVDKIIMQHHGVMNGHGYARYPWGGTTLAAQILFYSQDLSLRILTAHGKKLRDILSEFESSFQESPQIEIVNKFLKSFKAETNTAT